MNTNKLQIKMNFAINQIVESLKQFKPQSLENFRKHIDTQNVNFNISEPFCEDVSMDCELYYNFIVENIDIGCYNCDIQNEILCYIYYACYIVAHKYHCDYAVTNVGFSNVIRKDLNLINHYEIQVLKMLNYELNRNKYIVKKDLTIDIYETTDFEPIISGIAGTEYIYTLNLEYELERLIDDEQDVNMENDNNCCHVAYSVLKFILV